MNSNKKLSLTTSTSSPLAPLDPPSSLTIPGSGSNNNALRRPSQNYNFYEPNERRFYYISVKLLFRWLLLLWLTSGIAIYLMNAILYTHDKVLLLGLSANVIYGVALCNHLALIGAVYFDIGPLLVGCTIFQCALMVAVPALIVDVVPSLLTYGYLLLSIVMLLCYGVLYMRSSAPQGGMNRFDEENSRSYGGGGPGSSGGRKTSCTTHSSPAGIARHQSIAPESFSYDNNSPNRQNTLHQSNFSSSTSPLAAPRGSCQF